jgi:copper chaperone
MIMAGVSYETHSITYPASLHHHHVKSKSCNFIKITSLNTKCSILNFVNCSNSKTKQNSMSTKFKTSIKCSGCVDAVTPFLNESVGTGKWTVDLQSPIKTLTVDTDVDSKEVIDAMSKAGYKAEPIP